MRVYGDVLSGNCYKVRLLLGLLDIEHEWTHVDILAGDTRAAAFSAMNPNGKIPVLETDHGAHLCESNAILNYLAEGTEYLPADRFERARVLQWQFFEQYSHEPYIAVARFINRYLGLPEARRAEYESKQSGGRKALAVMQAALEQDDFLVAGRFTIADISLYAYTHVAHEGGFDLAEFPAICAWLRRIEQQPRFEPMPAGP